MSIVARSRAAAAVVIAVLPGVEEVGWEGVEGAGEVVVREEAEEGLEE